MTVDMDWMPQESFQNQVEVRGSRSAKDVYGDSLCASLAMTISPTDHPLSTRPPASEFMTEWCPGSSQLKKRETEAQIEDTKHHCPSLWFVAEPRSAARLLLPKKKKKVPHSTPSPPYSVYTVFPATLLSLPSSNSPKVPKLGAVIFTYRVGKGAKADAGAIQWRQLKLKHNEKAPPCQLWLQRTQ